MKMVAFAKAWIFRKVNCDFLQKFASLKIWWLVWLVYQPTPYSSV